MGRDGEIPKLGEYAAPVLKMRTALTKIQNVCVSSFGAHVSLVVSQQTTSTESTGHELSNEPSIVTIRYFLTELCDDLYSGLYYTVHTQIQCTGKHVIGGERVKDV